MQYRALVITTLIVVSLIGVGVLANDSNSEKKHCTGECQQEATNSRMNKVMPLKIKQHLECVAIKRCPTVAPSITGQSTPCINGYAGEYQCNNVDLLSYVSLADLGSKGDGNDIWGWTDPITKREYAIACCEDGTSFVDITDAINPVVVGFLPTQTTSAIWRDAKVYKDHAFIVSEAPHHGMQVFDLTQLRQYIDVGSSSSSSNNTFVNGVRQFTPTAYYDEFGHAHNIAINEETGFAYSVGSSTCRGGLHIVNISNPIEPEFAGCFAEDGYTHDTQCVVYNGPDHRFTGKEICFCYNEDTLTIVNVENKENPEMIARYGYAGSQYTHQGWLTPDQTHLVLNDELDEMYTTELDGHTRSLVWNVEKLTHPKLIGSFFSSETAIDHNLYLDDKYAYESNYCAGLRILDTAEIKSGKLSEVGFFDVAPDCDEVIFQGSWSAYPYFASGSIVVQSIERGLFVVKYNK